MSHVLTPRSIDLEPAAAPPESAGARAAPDVSAGPDRPLWAGLVLRWRWTLLAAWLVLQAVAFNGLWRVGIDSSQYRHVAHSLAAGQGYTILGQPQRQVYPGLPLLLAGLERLFGPAAWPGVIVMLLTSAAVLVVTYALLRRVWPPWAATVVTAGVAFNALFVKLGHELLTDMPFLLGVVLSLWGWEALSDKGRLKKVLAAAALLGGLGLAAAMRPTFWVLAAAFAIVCAGGLTVGLLQAVAPQLANRLTPRGWRPGGGDRARPWGFYAACLAVVLLVGLCFLALDPRTRTLSPLGGGYEAEVSARVLNLGARLRETPDKLLDMLGDNLQVAFFAEQMRPVHVVLAVCLLFGVGLAARRRPLWGVLVAMLLLTIYFASTQPRYYVMVLPVLWAGWLSLVTAGGRRLFKNTLHRSIFTGVLLGVVFAANVGHCVKFVVEQRSRPFLRGYEHGIYEPIASMADVVRRQTTLGETTIGPFAPVMSYWSDRRVIGRRELRIDGAVGMKARADVVRRSGARWMVFPHTVYEKKDKPLFRLTRIGVVAPTNRGDDEAFSAGTFNGDDWYLSPFGVDDDMLPPEDR